MKQCKVEACTSEALARELCSLHYQRLRRNNSLTDVKAERHGRYGTPEYRTYRHILNRCYNPKVSNYKYYGGRGITVCPRWKHSFTAFYEEMGSRPPGTEIDRIDNDGNYEPGNCHWVSKSENAHNRRMRSDNTSGYKGVTYQKKVGNYNARIMINGKSVNLGYYATPEQAARAYNKAKHEQSLRYRHNQNQPVS